MGKKYNKGRTQKPNYSKKGMINPQVEISKDLDLEEKVKLVQSESACNMKSGNKNQC